MHQRIWNIPSENDLLPSFGRGINFEPRIAEKTFFVLDDILCSYNRHCFEELPSPLFLRVFNCYCSFIPHLGFRISMETLRRHASVTSKYF